MLHPTVGFAIFASLVIFSQCAGAQEKEVSVPLGNGVEMKLIRVDAGTFTQGSPATERDRRADETQRHVTLTRGFYLGKYPVTRGQFAQFAKETGFRTESEVGTSGGFGWDGSQLVQRKEFTWKTPGFAQTDQDPVVMVTWPDAKAFLQWLSRKTGSQFDLPTEAQWEYACRAGTGTAFWIGDDPADADQIAWHKRNAQSRTHPVGEKGENAWGMGDMHGNVWEWCADWFGPYPTGGARDPVQTNSQLSDKPRRVLRGGSWLKDLASARSAARFRNDPQSRNADNGFRVMAFELRPPPLLERPASRERNPAPRPLVPLEQDTPSSQQPPHLPVPSDRSSQPLQFENRNSSGGGGIFWAAVFTAIGYAVVRFLFRRSSSASKTTFSDHSSFESGGGFRRPGSFRTRIGDDGFWIEADGFPAGTLLTCRYTASGETKQIEVRFKPQPGGQFIYTGSRPTTVSVTMGGSRTTDLGLAAGAIEGLESDDWSERQRRQQDEDERRQRRRSDPPAY